MQMQGSFWWKAHLKLVDLSKSMAKCNIGDGKSVLFWTDLWHSNCVHIKFPHLFTFVRDPGISVHSATQMEFLEDLFQPPLSVQAYEEFLQLENICDEVKKTLTIVIALTLGVTSGDHENLALQKPMT